MAVGVGIEPTSSRLTIERCTCSATLQEPGWPGENRTRCLTIKNRLLILMSFRPMVAMAGFEPAMTRLKDGRLSHLSTSPQRFWRSARESNSLQPGRQPGPSPAGLRSVKIWPALPGSNRNSSLRRAVPCPLDDGPGMARAGGFEPPSLPVRSRVS